MTVRSSLLLTAGGTLLFAIHMKAPICSLLTLIRFRFLPFHTASSEDISQSYEVLNVFTFSKPRPRQQPDLLPVLPPPTDAGPGTVRHDDWSEGGPQGPTEAVRLPGRRGWRSLPPLPSGLTRTGRCREGRGQSRSRPASSSPPC